jgi:cell division protease FtsH
MQLPLDEKHGYSKKYIIGRLAVMMGGRSAEEIIFNEITTGASNDIERATSIARKMVCEWGMSDKLGPMSFGKKNEEIFLGREIQSHRDYSEKTAQDIDNEVVRIIKNAQKDSHKILKEKIDLLHLMANELLEHETIDEKDIKLLVKGKKLPKKEIS